MGRTPAPRDGEEVSSELRAIPRFMAYAISVIEYQGSRLRGQDHCFPFHTEVGPKEAE